MCLLRSAHHISVQQYDAVLCVKVHALKLCYRPVIAVEYLLHSTGACVCTRVPVSVHGQNVYAEPHTL